MNHFRSFLRACAALAVAAGPLPATEFSASSTAGSAPLAQEAPRTTAWLGVATRLPDPVLATHLRLQEGFGLVIAAISEGSPAARAGLQTGDVLLRLDDQWLAHPQQLAALVRRHAAGTAITLHLLRDGQEQAHRATLGQRPAEAAGSRQTAQPFQSLPPTWSDRDEPEQLIREMMDRLRQGRLETDGLELLQSSGTWQRTASDGRFTATVRGGDGKAPDIEIVDAQGQASYRGDAAGLEASSLPPEAKRLARSILPAAGGLRPGLRSGGPVL